MRKTGASIDCHLCGRAVTVVRSGVSGKLARHKCPHGTWCQAAIDDLPGVSAGLSGGKPRKGLKTGLKNPCVIAGFSPCQSA